MGNVVSACSMTQTRGVIWLSMRGYLAVELCLCIKGYSWRESRAKIVANMKTNASLTAKISPWKWTNLQKMSVCQIFEFKFKFLENSRKPLTLKSTRKRIDEKPKWQRWGPEKAKRHWVLSEKKTSKRRERKPNRYQCRKRSSIYSGKPNQCSLYIWRTSFFWRQYGFQKHTKKCKYIRTWFSVLFQGRQTI